MALSDLQALNRTYQLSQEPYYPIAVVRGEGATLYDENGGAYLDFSGAMGKNLLGYGNALLVDAILEQALLLGCATPRLYQEPVARLAETLCERSGLSAACFFDSGRSAQNGLARLAKAYSRSRYHEGRQEIIYLSTDNDERYFPPFSRVLPPDMNLLRAQASGEICAVCFEIFPLHGEMAPLPRSFVHELAVFCAEQDWLLLVDETGGSGGRCGSLFAFQQYGFSPDLLAFSESLSGGLPLGGVLVGSRCRSQLAQWQDPESCTPNPICAVVASSLLEQLNEDLLSRAKETGDAFYQAVMAMDLPCVAQIHGTGLVLGLVIKEGYCLQTLANALAAGGLLCMEGRRGLILLPPLNVTKQELEQAVVLLQQVLGER